MNGAKSPRGEQMSTSSYLRYEQYAGTKSPTTTTTTTSGSNWGHHLYGQRVDTMASSVPITTTS